MTIRETIKPSIQNVWINRKGVVGIRADAPADDIKRDLAALIAAETDPDRLAVLRAFDPDAPAPAPKEKVKPKAKGAEKPKAAKPSDDIADTVKAETAAALERMNKRYCVVNDAGKAIILQGVVDPILNRKTFYRLGEKDLKLLHMNDFVRMLDAHGMPTRKPVAPWWLGHSKRDQYRGGLVFNPSGQTQPGVLNLWTGFAVKPAAGDWSLMRNHIRDVVCDGDPVRFDYLMGWLARMFQCPAQQGEVAVVMRGGEGAGKGILARAVKKILGQHGLQISNAKHIVGNFNVHLRDCLISICR